MKPFNIIWLCLFCFQKYEKLAKAQLKKVTKIYAQEKKKSEDREKKEVIDEVMKFINKMYLGHLYEDAKVFLILHCFIHSLQTSSLGVGWGRFLSLFPTPTKKKRYFSQATLYTASILINLCAVFNPSSPVFQHQNQYSPIFSVILRGEFGSLVTDLSWVD